MRKRFVSVVLAGLSLLSVGCGGGSPSSGGSTGNGGGGNPPPVTLTSIAVSTLTSSIAPGTTAQFTAQGKFSDNTTQNLTSQVTWSSSQTSVATMNANGIAGLAKGVAAGTSTITASMSGVSGTATLRVTNAKLTSINVTPANPSINVGTQQPFAATGSFSDGTTQDISTVCTWASTVTKVAVVTTNSGVATGKASGTTTITASFATVSGSVSGSTQLTVTLANLISLAISPSNPTLAVNTSGTFVAVGTFSDGSTHNLTNQVTWASSATNVATIPAHNSLATAVAPGTTTISATSGSVTGSTILTVSNATLSSLTVAPSGTSIPAGVQVNFTAIGTFSDSSTQNLTTQVNWSSSNTGVATISNAGGSKGLATAVAPGSTVITATSPASLGSVASTPVSLTVNTATLTSIAVSPTSAQTAPAGNVQFNATGSYSDGSTQLITRAVTWTSSNATIATVSANGLATGQGVGNVNITATQNAKSGSAGLLVTSSQLTSITIAPPNTSKKIAEQTSVQLAAIGQFADGTTQNLTNAATWTSSAPSTATVTGNGGFLTGLAPGSVTVVANFGSVSGNLQLTVTNATLGSVAISPTSATISLGTTQQFTATASFSDGTTEVVTTSSSWSSSNLNVAVVDNSGLASTSGTGTATITVTTTQNAVSKSATASLTVN